MSVFYYLLGIDVPPGTTLHELSLQFRGGLPWWLVVLLGVVLGLIVLALYLTERGKVNLAARLTMTVLRTAALVLLLLLICKPLLQAEFAGKRPREIVLLIDNTQSMKQQDRRFNMPDKLRVALASGKLEPGTSVSGDQAPQEIPTGTAVDPERAQLVRDSFSNTKFALLEKLQKQGPVVPVLFGYDTRNALEDFSLVNKRAVTWADLKAKFDTEQTQTSLADAINSLLQRKDTDLPAAIAVVTDGLDTTSKNSLEEVAAECARLKVPLHIYGVGSADSGRLKVRDLVVAPTLFAEDSVTIPVRWRADGMDKGPATAIVTVTVAGKTETKRVPITSGLDQVTAFQFTLPKNKEKDKPQEDEVVATVKLLEDETFKHSLTQPVRIIDGKVKVLYIEYAPRKEYHFLQTALLRDRRLDVRFWLITSDPKAASDGPFEKDFPAKKDVLNQYDVVILGDVPVDRLKKAQQQMLLEYVGKNRGGLVVIAGRQHLPASYLQEDLAKALPVEFDNKKFLTEGPGSPQSYAPRFTAAGVRADFLALGDTPEDNLKQWQELPGFFWHYPISKLSPGATALLEHPTAKMGDQPMPLLVYQRYGQGPVLYFGFEETWRWRFNTQDKIFSRFWGQVILYMALPHKLKTTATLAELSVDRGAMILGKPGMLHARLFTRDYEAYKRAKVEAIAEFLDAQPGQQRQWPIVLEPVAGRESEGEYTAVLTNSFPGRWKVVLPDPVPATFAYTVTVPVKHEMEEIPMAADALRSAASISGGRFYREETLHELPGNLAPQETAYLLRQEVNLWGALPFILFTCLVAAEWLLRKLTNLS